MANIKISAVKDGEAVYSQQNKTWSQLWLRSIISSLLQNSGLNWKKKGKPLGYSGMT